MLLSVLLAGHCALAQHSLLKVFSDDNEKFYLYVDGKKINDHAQSYVEGVILKNDFQQIKVVGEFDSELNVSKRLESKDMDGNYCRLTVCLVMAKNGKYKLRLKDYTPMTESDYAESAPPATPAPSVETPAPAPEPVVVAAKEETNAEPEKDSQVALNVNDNGGGNVSYSITTTKTTTTKKSSDNLSLNLNISDDEGEGSISFSISGKDSKGNGQLVVTESETTEVVEISSSSSSSSVSSSNIAVAVEVDDNTADASESELVDDTPAKVVEMPGYEGSVGCSNLVGDAEFATIKKSVAAKTFEDTRLSVAKEIVTKKCMSAQQVLDLMKLLDFEDSRLELAKKAYAHTYDQDNFYKVYDAFDIELTIEELQEYIKSGEDKAEAIAVDTF